MELLKLEIVTNRLLLIPIPLKYKEEIFQEFTAEITTYTYPRTPQKISETEAFINQSISEMEKGDNLVIVILKKDSQEFLGCSGINNINSPEPELGIWLKKSAQGNNYGWETINALKQWAEENLDYKYLIYPVDKDNIPSRRIAEKISGQISRQYNKTNMSGRVLHLLEYKITKK
ncbi:MAG: GNAT family N-acetyltransferase [Nostocaceae cyanobacterium]|nr:GNAT family N-acetyltransferase [Nostocaceae cyanobacterium]